MKKYLLFVMLFVLLLVTPVHAQSVDISSYDAFKASTNNGTFYDTDGQYGAQCWDGANLVWMQLGRWLITGGPRFYAKECWIYSRNENAGSDFSLIFRKEDIKRGDIIIFNGPLETGHIAFAEENYTRGMQYMPCYGQNQLDGNGSVGHCFTVHPQNLGYFLGAFRLHKWNNQKNNYAAGTSFIKNGAIYTVKNSSYLEYTSPVSENISTATIPATFTVGNNKKFKVTAIGAGAFKNCKNLTAVKVGKNVTAIGKQAFAACTKLKTVSLGSGLKTIGVKAFFRCTSLQKITLPAGLRKIGTQAFYGDKKLTQMTIGSSRLSSLGKKVFTGIPAKAKINVPNKMIKAYKNMFQTAGLNTKVKVY